MGLRAPANGRSITPVCFRGYCRIRRKEQRVTHFTLLCLSLPVAVWRIHGAPSRYKFRIISAARSRDEKTTRMEKYNDTEELCQICVSCRNIRRRHTSRNVRSEERRVGKECREWWLTSP